MISNPGLQIPNWARLSRVLWLPAAGLALLAAGCSTFRLPPRRTSVESSQTILHATLVSNFLVIETEGDRNGPWHFIIDTGSSITLITPELARRFDGRTSPKQHPVRVRGAGGRVQSLTPVTLKRLRLGEASFEGVQALMYEFDDISNHLGVRIDGILGFPLFRETLLTLDYFNARVLITPRSVAVGLPGVTIPFNNEQNTPLIPIQLGNESFIALVDSGSDSTLSLNTVGLHPQFVFGPRPGVLVATLTGDILRMTGRLSQPLNIGAYLIENPIVDVTDELSSIGGGLLRYFTVTFDQMRNQVTFFRPSYDPIRTSPMRSTGLSFSRTPAYWRVEAVVTESPAELLGVQGGDLCTRINGEPVAAWPLPRYTELVRSAERITYTFINGDEVQEATLPVFELVP